MKTKTSSILLLFVALIASAGLIKYGSVAKADTKNIPETVSIATTENKTNPIFAETDIASSITTSAATISGSWQGDNEVSTWFEYGSTMDLGKKTKAVTQKTKSGFTTYRLTGLSPNSAYYFRLSGKDENSQKNGQINSFVTLAHNSNAPNYAVAMTNGPSNITASSAKLNAYIDPNGSSGGYWFEYGNEPTLLENSTPAIKLDSGHPIFVEEKLANLDSNKSYYFRIAARNTYGIVRGSTLRFDTAAARNENPNPAAVALSRGPELTALSVCLGAIFFLIAFCLLIEKIYPENQ